jgi:RNA polymerase sigma-70 factor, ECF subfamily
LSGRKKRQNTEPDGRPWNPAAWAKLYADHYPQVRSWLLARLGREHDADDLADEVFARLADGGTPDDPGPHVARLASSVLRRHRRRRAREQAGLRSLLAQTMRGSEPEPERGEPADADGFSPEVRETLKKALAELPAGDVNLLRLRIVEELPIAEVARRMGCSQAAAYKRIERLVQRLRARCGVEFNPPKNGSK